jgi:flavin reductase (DIM6/NTAB) family NADH-FMN oxidoreductase RutF
MQFEMDRLSARDRYKLLTAVIVPRPIALVTSRDPEGHLNAAPFSYFNLMGTDPPVVVLGPGDRGSGEPKDTPRNIRHTGEFVINGVNEEIAARMNVCAVDFPPGVNELEPAGLTAVPSIRVGVPRIAESPVQLECREVSTVEIGRVRVILGEVLVLHLPDLYLDPVRLHVHTDEIGFIGRMHGSGWYAKTNDLFNMPRMTYEEWLLQSEKSQPGGYDTVRDTTVGDAAPDA